MGLTIHYQLQAPDGAVEQARQLVEKLRQKALDLPFQEVGALIERRGRQANFRSVAFDHPERWLLIQAEFTKIQRDHYLQMAPDHVIAFSTLPGNGSEPANFGLALYSRAIAVDDQGRSRRLPIGLPGWSWSSFCKTEYASLPQCGGVEHFLKCHLTVIKLLDHAGELGILKHVNDEGNYWNQRDIAALTAMFGGRHAMTEGWAKRLKDAFDPAIALENSRALHSAHRQAQERRNEAG